MTSWDSTTVIKRRGVTKASWKKWGHPVLSCGCWCSGKTWFLLRTNEVEWEGKSTSSHSELYTRKETSLHQDGLQPWCLHFCMFVHHVCLSFKLLLLFVCACMRVCAGVCVCLSANALECISLELFLRNGVKPVREKSRSGSLFTVTQQAMFHSSVIIARFQPLTCQLLYKYI